MRGSPSHFQARSMLLTLDLQKYAQVLRVLSCVHYALVVTRTRDGDELNIERELGLRRICLLYACFARGKWEAYKSSREELDQIQNSV